MKIFTGGIRGTETITDPAYQEYGGDTICLWIEGDNGDGLMLDMGSGVRWIDPILKEKSLPKIRVLMSHYHLDHINGLPRFSPLYDSKTEVECRGPSLSGRTCEDIFHQVMGPPIWPVPLTSLGEKNTFDTVEGSDFEWGPFHIQTQIVSHFDGYAAYRIEDKGTGTSVFVATDMEWLAMDESQRERFYELCGSPTPVDALFFDGHVHPNDVDTFKGWGHSTWQDAVNVFNETGAKQLHIVHHAPYHGDKALAEMEAACQSECRNASFARQGEWIALG